MTLTALAIAASALMLLSVTPQAHAAFSASATSGVARATTDALERYIEMTPGAAVQPGTGTLTTTGSGMTLAVDLGRIPDTRTITDVIRLRNLDTVAHTINLAVLAGLTGIAGFEYADGTVSKALTPGVVYPLRARTTTANAGLQNGDISFTDGAMPGFLRRDRPLTTRQAPNPPTGLTATRAAPPTVRITIDWTASASTGVSGYNVYRATAAGGPYAKINASLVAGTSYADNTITVGQRYWYFVRGVAAGVIPGMESLDSATVNARYAPAPTLVRVPAGGSNPANYVNNATRAGVTTLVDVPASSAIGDVVNVRYTSGATNVTRTFVLVAGGAQTVSVTGADVSTLADGPVTLTAWMTDSGADGNAVTGAATKDVVAAVNSSYIAATASNPVNFINIATGVTPGTATGAIDLPASSMATDTLTLRLTSGANTTTAAAAGMAGAGIRTLAGLNTNGWAQGAVAVAARVQDVAGNDSGWIAGTAATRDTVVPTPPTAARILATAVNPVDTINIATQAAAGVSVTTSAGAVSVEARLTVAAVSVYGTQIGSGTVLTSVNATTLADAAAGGVQVAARQFDAAGNPSTWFIGTAALKDTVAPNAPDFKQVRFQNVSPGLDNVWGNNGALGSYDQVRIADYADGAMYPTIGWDSTDAKGNFGRDDIAASVIPRTLGYDIRDSAWNPIARICRYYTANGTGSAIACP